MSETKNTEMPAMLVAVALPGGDQLFVEIQPESLASDGKPNRCTVRVYRENDIGRSGIVTTLTSDAPDKSIDPERVARCMADGVANFADLYKRTANGPTRSFAGRTKPDLLN